ncbi:MAG: chorismate--pyruvate lyase [Clostridiales bacterium]|nr:chorismate--pyruvate lyase [Clostridiales bacterium]MCD7801835.1 chorismate--pyruvate lyase [Clostridiales bacterium]
MDISPKEYVVDQIVGDYAMLRRTDAPSDQLNQVALALLPEGLEVGSRLRWELFTYTLLR